MEIEQFFQEQSKLYSSRPLRESIFFVVKTAIIEGLLLPGDHLTEEDLANRFNCSRTPVREALRKLEQENLIKVKPGVGMEIPNIDVHLLQQEMDLRILLEELSIKNACQTITEEKLGQLEWSTYKLQKALKQHNFIEASRANDEFHNQLYHFSDNVFVQKASDMLWISSRVAFLSARQDSTILDDNDSHYYSRINDHLLLIDAIRDKDVQTALEISRQHIKESYSHFLQFIEHSSL